MHRSQVFLYILLAFIGGIFFASFFLIPQNYIWTGIIICAGLIVVFFRRDSRLLNPKAAFIAFLALIFLFGALRFNISYLRRHILQEFARAAAQIVSDSGRRKMTTDLVGYISSEPEISGKAQTLIFRSKQVIAGNRALNTDENVLLTVDVYPRYQYGQQVRVVSVLQLPQNLPESDFDYVTYLAKSGIYTIIKFPEVKDIALNLSLPEKTKIWLMQKIFLFKNAFEDTINRSIAEPNAAFINGLLLGSRSQIPDDLKDAFAKTSTTHILAISGFNITIITEMLAGFFIFFFRRRTAFWFAVSGIAVFTILTGAQASVTRAAIMGCLLLLAQRAGRPYAARNAVVFAGTAMIFLNPNILRYDIGFQLSFMATLGLVYFSPYLAEKLRKLPKFMNIRENTAMTLSAQAAVLPLILYYFKNFSLVSLPANILILPLVPLSMILGFAVGVLGMIMPFLGTIAGYFAWLSTSIQIGIVRLFAQPSWAAISVKFPWYAVVALYTLIVLAAVKLSKHDRPETG